MSTSVLASLDAQVVSSVVQGIGFGYFTDREIRKLSVQLINNPEAFDVLGLPLPRGLYDPALGPIDFSASCITCGLMHRHCPGHFGHIQLSLPVYHPALFRKLLQLVKHTCLTCHRFKLNIRQSVMWATKFRLLSEGKLMAALQFEKYFHCEIKSAQSSGALSSSKKGKKSKGSTTLKKGKKSLVEEKFDESTDDDEEEDDGEEEEEKKGKSKHEKGGMDFSLYLNAAKQAMKRVTTEFEDSSYSNASRMGDAQHLKSARTAAVRAFFASFPTVKCGKCGAYCPPVTQSSEVSFYRAPKKGAKHATDGKRKTKPVLLPPNEVMELMKQLWMHERDILSYIWQCGPRNPLLQPHKNPDHDYLSYFLRNILVAPPRFRPLNRVNDSIVEHPQNVYLTKIMNLNEDLLSQRKNLNSSEKLEVKKPSNPYERDEQTKFGLLQRTWALLQSAVNFLVDNSRGMSPLNVQSGKIIPPGIRQLLEKKEGLLRRNMMGKRVNFSARSVISPDPYIATNEIGVPHYFATNLTYPEPVTSFNYHQLAEAVINGPEQHPGANAVEDEKGYLIRLAQKTKAQRVAIARTLRTMGVGAQRKVHRHARDGDIVLLNRQPTLHKPGIMAHKVRVLGNEKTLRMHYANCKTYNADFDGDEMNVHLPQDEVSRAEAYEIALSDRQYLVPRDGSPLRGLIQDNICTGILLTKKDVFFERQEISQLLYAACSGEPGNRAFVLPQPAILLPVQRWTGKQVVTALLNFLLSGHEPLTMQSRCKVAAKLWGKFAAEESSVIIRQNHMLTGILGKSQFGASKFGLVHAIHELYGATLAGSMLTALCRLFTVYLQMSGFTCGMDDLLLAGRAEKERVALLNEATVVGSQVASAFAVGQTHDPATPLDESILEEEAQRKASAGMRARLLDGGEHESAILDGMIKSGMHQTTSSIISACLPEGQRKLFPLNNLSLMTVSGAKGSVVNFSQISCLLGQQELEGKRVPRMASGRTLPSFEPYDPTPRAGGFIGDRFLSGIRPQEYFFHCMAGREGLVDTAVKTANSGYLQRCLIKQLESLRVHYDQTVRTSDGGVVQFNYGEDGLDVTKTSYLDQFPFYLDNYRGFLQKFSFHQQVPSLDTRSALRYKRRARKRVNPDPVLSVHNPGVCVGSVSEEFDRKLDAFLASPEAVSFFAKSKVGKHRVGGTSFSEKEFKMLMYFKYMNSLAEPGEAVGLLASQSVGEPSTQMTLNTFHLAGRGEANVTLGIPRLREIVMTASANIRTPTMILPLKKGCTKEDAGILAKRFEMLTLNALIQDLRVVEKLNVGPSGVRQRYYTVRMKLSPASIKSAQLSFEDMMECLQSRFLPSMLRNLKRQIDDPSRIGSSVKVIAPSNSLKASERKRQPTPKKSRASKAASFTTAQEEEDELSDQDLEVSMMDASGKSKDSADEDEGTSVEKAKRKKRDGVSFGEADEEDEMAMAQVDMHEEEGDGFSKVVKKNTSDTSSLSQRKSVSQRTRVAGATDHTVVMSSERLLEYKEKLLSLSSYLRNYEFDKKKSLLEIELAVPASEAKVMMLNLFERMVDSFVVQCIGGISKCFVIEYELPGTNEKRPAVQTEGVNLGEVLSHMDFIDVNKVYTNDISAILHRYGVEAANAAITREISGVFGVYGISVNPRHLSLVSDYMTYEGGYKAFNRVGIASDSSPLLKMSFETTMKFLVDATVTHDMDWLHSPAASLVLGNVVENGTGCFDLRSKPLTL